MKDRLTDLLFMLTFHEVIYKYSYRTPFPQASIWGHNRQRYRLLSLQVPLRTVGFLADQLVIVVTIIGCFAELPIFMAVNDPLMFSTVIILLALSKCMSSFL